MTKSEQVCPKCLELLIKIRNGEITGAVLSCHPLAEIADVVLKPYIDSRKMTDVGPTRLSNDSAN